MSSLVALKLAIELAEVQRDQALAMLQKEKHLQQYAQGQMHQLNDYAAETDQRWGLRAQAPTSPELLQSHVLFMQKLEQAIALQHGVLGQSAQKVQNAQALLLKAEQKLASFKQLVALRQAQEARAQQRLEQKLTDEMAAQQAMRRSRPTQEITP
jgi:flagellar FliJ protein